MLVLEKSDFVTTFDSLCYIVLLVENKTLKNFKFMSKSAQRPVNSTMAENKPAELDVRSIVCYEDSLPTLHYKERVLSVFTPLKLDPPHRLVLIIDSHHPTL
jgi:hypothetical protein